MVQRSKTVTDEGPNGALGRSAQAKDLEPKLGPARDRRISPERMRQDSRKMLTLAPLAGDRSQDIPHFDNRGAILWPPAWWRVVGIPLELTVILWVVSDIRLTNEDRHWPDIHEAAVFAQITDDSVENLVLEWLEDNCVVGHLEYRSSPGLHARWANLALEAIRVDLDDFDDVSESIVNRVFNLRPQIML
jgi:hypothetical protein